MSEKLTGAEFRKCWHRVKPWRDRGVEVKWSRYKGAPCIVVRRSDLATWFVVDRGTLDCICHALDRGETLREAVDTTLAIAHLFSL